MNSRGSPTSFELALKFLIILLNFSLNWVLFRLKVSEPRVIWSFCPYTTLPTRTSCYTKCSVYTPLMWTPWFDAGMTSACLKEQRLKFLVVWRNFADMRSDETLTLCYSRHLLWPLYLWVNQCLSNTFGFYNVSLRRSTSNLNKGNGSSLSVLFIHTGDWGVSQ